MRSSALALLALVLSAAPARDLQSGPQVVTFHSAVDDSDQPYALYVPRDLDPNKRYPLVISLHGENSSHQLSLRRVFGRGNRPGETVGEASRYFPVLPDVPFLVAAPRSRGTMGYQGIAEQDVYDVLADVKRRFAVDEDRIYLTGTSNGGGGALRFALTRPDVWAAVAAVCPEIPAGLEELAGNAANLPVQVYQGEQDPLVPAPTVRNWQKRLLQAGVSVEYIEYPRVRHNAWDAAYANGRIFEWFALHTRNRQPDRVRFATRQYKYAAAYWLRIDRLTPGSRASVDAAFTGATQITVATEGADAFTLQLAARALPAARQPVRLLINGAPVIAKPAAELSFHRVAGVWKPGRSQPAAAEKQAGAEGPLPEAIATRHLYVYGTADNPGDEERARRRKIAERAGAWSASQARYQLSLPVVADREVAIADAASANLILFGTKETNSLIARLAAILPMTLNPSAADYGLVTLTPDHGRYIVVNSGLPWWTGAEQARRTATPRARPPYPPWLVLETFPDYILFKGSLENVVAEGRFANDWSVPAREAATIKATGAVEIR